MKSKKTIMKEIEDLIAYEQDGKEINNWKFGVELEYGGYSNRIEYSREDENNLIETIKSDGSVAGDGTEYNLKPISFEDIKTKKMVRNLESFCYRVANKRCTISSTAGMHIHFSWDKEYSPTEGREMGQILTNIARWLFYDFAEKYRINNLLKENSRIRDYKLKTPTDALEWIEDDNEKLKTEMIKKLYDAFQFLYSVSNRDGTESYGLGTNYTRGYTSHGTLELRCWRTSYDYREILARVFVARFFLQYILRIGLYEKNGLMEEITNIESIWQMLNKKENERLKSMYEYLAYNVRNKHKMGLPLHMLMANLKTYDAGYATEVKKRSDIYNKSLIKNTSAKKAKEMFETIINFEEKGEEDESRV